MCEDFKEKEIEYFFDKLKPSLLSLIRKARGFDGTVETEDLLNEAKMAISEGLRKFRRWRVKNIKKKNFLFWFIQRRLFQKIDANRVIYDIIDERGNLVASLPAREFFRKKGEFVGMTIKTKNVFVDIENHNGRPAEERLARKEGESV